MKNGNGPGRAAVCTVQSRRIVALLLAAACALVLLPVRADSPEPILTDVLALDTPWNEKQGRIPTPTNRQECFEDCDYDWGKETEKCNRLPKKKRPECHSKALAKRSKCRSDCEKKYPE